MPLINNNNDICVLLWVVFDSMCYGYIVQFDYNIHLSLLDVVRILKNYSFTQNTDKIDVLRLKKNLLSSV
jgi:hypothetical protein